MWDFPKSFLSFFGVLLPTVITYIILWLVDPLLIGIVPSIFAVIFSHFSGRWNLDFTLSIVIAVVMLPYVPWLMYLAETAHQEVIREIKVQEVMES